MKGKPSLATNATTNWQCSRTSRFKHLSYGIDVHVEQGGSLAQAKEGLLNTEDQNSSSSITLTVLRS